MTLREHRIAAAYGAWQRVEVEALHAAAAGVAGAAHRADQAALSRASARDRVMSPRVECTVGQPDRVRFVPREEPEAFATTLRAALAARGEQDKR